MFKKSNKKEIGVLIITVLLFLSSNLVYSQSKETIVTYDIDKRDFEGILPFDESFKIKFKSTKPISLIQVKYKIDQKGLIDDQFKKKYYFQKDADVVNGYLTSDLRNVSFQSFSIGGIGPLHPNTPYIFEFYIYEKINATDNTANSLKADVEKFINKLYLNTDVLPDPGTITGQFNSVLQKYVTNLYDEEGNALTVQNIFSSDLQNYKSDLTIAKTKIEQAIKNNDSDALQIEPSDFGANFCNLIENLDSKNLVNPDLLDEPMSLLIEGYSNVTLKEMINFYKLNCNRDFTYSSSIINGRAKYNNKLELQVLPKEQRYKNIESLELLKSSIILMNKLKLKSGNSHYFRRAIDSSVNTLLDNIITEEKIINDNRTKISELNADTPNILLNKFSQTAFRNDYKAITEVESAATPYINLDLGVLYASELKDVFALQTVNFHLLPVNRNALFSELKGWDKFFKQACLQVGLAQRLGPTDESYHTFLTGDLGTPYVGLGFRVNRILRVSTGMIVYREENNNPIITDKITKGSFSFTITINSALSSALGLVGGIFKGVNK
ncbi:hypothetical protein SGQ83_00305 [Flavobacterium sp. Fl-318]|uniref:Uncharacterized protein n=1 Tax=Flavobacterium cupriresistens TaxID=2893885 RepID=A0ABU4R5B5_9FLAO|nr:MULTISPECIES: hypothetical protein [unclassified Flavobacterium]MDX6187777.1 hypothetical protein [Flavobacterium sp. Fl-318]UFH42300.1 hypothetical protein LNP23_21145 [Flavobacterium sp. F-323]